MTTQEVRERVEAIERTKHDPEVAHGLEDTLYKIVLSEIASGRHNMRSARILAREALKAREIEFARWAA